FQILNRKSRGDITIFEHCFCLLFQVKLRLAEPRVWFSDSPRITRYAEIIICAQIANMRQLSRACLIGLVVLNIYARHTSASSPRWDSFALLNAADDGLVTRSMDYETTGHSTNA